jgi:hypothetical protein
MKDHEAEENTAPGGTGAADCSTLGDALSREIERCQELLVAYAEIGPAGAFGAAMIRADIAAAHKAMMEGDCVAMIRAYEALKGCQ